MGAPDQYGNHVGNHVMRYLAVLRAARDFGLPDEQIAVVAGRFDPGRTRSAELADALADLILARGLGPMPSA